MERWNGEILVLKDVIHFKFLYSSVPLFHHSNWGEAPRFILMVPLSDMAFPAHDRAILIFLVASFAIQVKRFDERWFAIFTFQFMTIRTHLVFRRFIGQLFSIFINVVAFIARFNLSDFVVFVVPKDGRNPFSLGEGAIVNDLHVFLRIGTGKGKH